MISDRLRSARELAGLSQSQVAEMLGVHRPTISEIEAGRRKVPAEELTVFADIYGVSGSWILGEHRESASDPALALAARELERLSADDLEKVIKVLSVLQAGRGGL